MERGGSETEGEQWQHAHIKNSVCAHHLGHPVNPHWTVLYSTG